MATVTSLSQRYRNIKLNHSSKQKLIKRVKWFLIVYPCKINGIGKKSFTVCSGHVVFGFKGTVQPIFMDKFIAIFVSFL